MKRSLHLARNRAIDFLDLNALVLSEIESLGKERPHQTANGRGDSSPVTTGGAGDPEVGQARVPTQAPSYTARIHPGRGQDGPARSRSGEEAEGLFDQSFDLAEEDEGGPADGPTAADLLTPEEQAFIARAVGFLSGRPNADLILDRVWSQAIQSRPDGFYDPDTPDLYPGADPEPAVGEDPGKSSAVGQPIPARAAEPTAGAPPILPGRPAPAPAPDPPSLTQGPPE